MIKQLNFKQWFLEKLMMTKKKRQYLHAQLVGLLLLSACSTLQQSRSYAQSGQPQSLSHSCQQKTSSHLKSSGGLLNSPSIMNQQCESQQVISPYQVLQVSEQSLDSTSLQEDQNNFHLDYNYLSYVFVFFILTVIFFIKKLD